jgi:hypothetical protein
MQNSPSISSLPAAYSTIASSLLSLPCRAQLLTSALSSLNCSIPWVKVKVTLWLTVSQSVSQSVSLDDQICITVWHLRSCFLWGALSDERSGLSFVYSAGPRQLSLSRVRVPWYLRPYFTVSDLRLSFSLPPTTRRLTTEVFNPASTQVNPLSRPGLLIIYSWGGPNGKHHLSTILPLLGIVAETCLLSSYQATRSFSWVLHSNSTPCYNIVAIFFPA